MELEQMTEEEAYKLGLEALTYEEQVAFNVKTQELWATILKLVEIAAKTGKGIRLSAEETKLLFLRFDDSGD